MSHLKDLPKRVKGNGLILVVCLSAGVAAGALYIADVIGVDLEQTTIDLIAVIIGLIVSTGVVMFQTYGNYEEQQAREQKLERFPPCF